jgi:hypothetical protein
MHTNLDTYRICMGPHMRRVRYLLQEIDFLFAGIQVYKEYVKNDSGILMNPTIKMHNRITKMELFSGVKTIKLAMYRNLYPINYIEIESQYEQKIHRTNFTVHFSIGS